MRPTVLASLLALATLGISTEATAIPGGRNRGTPAYTTTVTPNTTAFASTSTGARSHRGFMARLCVGAGYLTTSETVGPLSLTVSGAAGAAHIALGANLTPGLSLHGTLWSSIAIAPSASVSTVGTAFTSTTSSSTALSQTAIGVGLTYALLDADVFFTGSLGIGLLSVSTTRGSVTTSTNAGAGFAFNLGVGRHWAVSPDWGLGLMGQFVFQTDTDTVGASDYGISTLGATLFFSAAYH